MASEQQLAAIAAALSIVLEAEVVLEAASTLHPWGLAARHELVGSSPGYASPDELPPLRRQAP